jgi:hypothetical protein
MSYIALEDSFEALLVGAYKEAFGKDPTPEWSTALAMRAGTRGSIATLDETGRFLGVTRERVRQVMQKVTPRLAGKSLEGLREVADTLAERSPVPEPIGRRLARSGKSRTTLTGAGFLNMLNLLGTSPQELIGKGLVAVDGWLVEESEVPVMKAFQVANRHTSAYGLTTVEEIRQAMATMDNPLDPVDIRRVLRTEPTVKWHGDWLWVDKQKDALHSNRLINTARAVLSVNSPQTVASIHEGARRVWKFRQLDILPSVDAMKAFFEASPYFVVNGDDVAPIEPLDYHAVLGGVTVAMIEVLKSSPYQVMDRQSLHEACADAGIARGTFGVWTTYAEWMERFAPSVWGLRGSKPNPAAVETVRLAALARSKAEPHRKSWSWGSDGAVIQTLDVTTSLLNTGVLSFDTEVSKLLAGQSIAIFMDGEQVATAKVGTDHLFSWGWFPALKALGAQRGEVLRVTINLGTRVADVRSGGQELWADA